MASIDSAKSNYRKIISIPKEELENYLTQGRKNMTFHMVQAVWFFILFKNQLKEDFQV